jgi:pimeloyl-ACP methyl ester carboxylesterase
MRDHARSWDWVARRLRRDWRIVAVDLRGHGDSEWAQGSRYAISDHVLDLANLVDLLLAERGGQEPLTFIAHSFGGNVVARYISAYPDRARKLVLVEGLGPSPPVLAEWSRLGLVERTRRWIENRQAASTATPRLMASLAEAARRIMIANPRLSDEQAAHLARHGARLHDDGYRWKYDPQVSLFPPEDFSALGPAVWAAIPAPTLVFYGMESWTTNPEEDGRAGHLPNHRTLAFERAGHWVHHDRFDAFMAALVDFL